MTPLMSGIMLFNAISVLLLLILLFIYLRNLKSVKSRLLIGLILFVFVFLVQNIFSLYYSLTMMEYYVPAVELHVFIYGLLQMIAFAIMLYITWE